MSEGVDICYLLSNGFAARMVLQTDIIPEIRKRGLTVAAILPAAAATAANDLRERYDIDVRLAPAFDGSAHREHQLLRRYIFEDIEKNPSLWATHNMARQKSITRRIRLGTYLALNKIARRSRAVRTTLQRLEAAFLHDRTVSELLDALNPRVVVATYPVSRLEANFMQEASRKSILTVGHLLSWDNITSKGRFPAPPDRYITWGPVMTDEVVEYYAKSRNDIFECGVAHFDRHLERLDPDVVAQTVASCGLNPTRPFIFFGMSNPYFAPHEVEIATWLADKVRAGTFGPDMQLLLRPHPQSVRTDGAESWIDGLVDIAGDGVAVNYPALKKDGLEWSMEEADLDLLVALFRASAVTMSTGSTFAIDGIMHDKPVIITAFDGSADLPWYLSARRVVSFHHLRKFVDFGGCHVAESFEDLEAGIKRYVDSPDADADGRRAARHGECGPCDGHTAERVAAALESMLQTEVGTSVEEKPEWHA